MRRREGSATLELTVIFPLILYILLSIIFFTLFIYYKMVSMDTAVYTVRERASTWNNSYKNIENGSLGGTMKNDGLYWRITDDSSDSALVLKKLTDAERFSYEILSTGMINKRNPGSLNVSYEKSLLRRTVSSSEVIAEVSEPAEFIRNFTLGKEYLNQFLGYIRNFGRNTAQGNTQPVIASKNSNVYGQKLYHFSGCRYVARIKQQNLLEFQSEDQAIQQGFHLCIECAALKLGAGDKPGRNK